MEQQKNRPATTQAQWFQWRLDFAQRLKGITLRYQRYKRWSEEWDHDHCAACWAKFAEFDGCQHAGYATCEDYNFGACYDWVCRNCFDELKEFMGWKVASGSERITPPRSASVWSKGRVPRIECSITFLSPAEGGRTVLPSLSGDEYRPHLVIGDPKQRKGKTRSRDVPGEEYIGVALHQGPMAREAGKELPVVMKLIYFPNPMYGKLNPGVSFTVREGPRVIGYGAVRRWLD
jgi:hypothetical protein